MSFGLINNARVTNCFEYFTIFRYAQECIFISKSLKYLSNQALHATVHLRTKIMMFDANTYKLPINYYLYILLAFHIAKIVIYRTN